MANLFIDPKMLNKVQEQSNPLLNVPPDAAPGRNRSFRWSELLTITGTSVTEVDKGRTAIEVKFRVSLASPTAANRGKNTRARYLINLDAPQGSGDETMTMISLGNIHQLLRAAVPNLIMDNGLDLEEVFGPNSPLINLDVIGVMVDKPDREDANIRRQEVQRYSSIN